MRIESEITNRQALLTWLSNVYGINIPDDLGVSDINVSVPRSYTFSGTPETLRIELHVGANQAIVSSLYLALAGKDEE